MEAHQLIAMDTETHKIYPGHLAPPMVCMSVADMRGAEVIHRRDHRCRREVVKIIDNCLAHTHYLAGHNIAYDLAVWANEWPELLPLIFRMLDEDRVLDTMVRQCLIDIARGEYRRHGPYNLAVLAKRHEYPVYLDKDTWRLRYAEFDEVPVDQWPSGAVEYSRHDSLATLHVCASQEADVEYLDDQYRQVRAAWALHLISAWGIRTDEIMVRRHRALTEAKIAEYQDQLLAADLIYSKKGKWHKRDKKAREMCAAAWALRGFDEIPKDFATDGGAASISEDACDALGNPLMTAYQVWSSSSTVLARVAELEQGIEYPIHTRFDPIMDTGRTSSSNPNIQARATKPGDRECFVPRKGMVYLDSDFDGLELRTICQSLIYAGIEPRMAEVLRKGEDPHAMVAAQLLGISYDEVIRRKDNPEDDEVYLARQCGKIGNFGLNAGLGWRGLIVQARAKYGVTLDEAGAKRLIATWRETWPEFTQFFAWIRAQTVTGSGWAKHFVSNRCRGNIPYTVMCNTYSQGLGADAMKCAMYNLVKECYIGTGILRGCRVVNFIHDQFITETPDCDQLDEFSNAYQKVLTESANIWLPDIPTRAKPMVARRWSKLAKRTVDARGRLIPWEWSEAIKAGSKGYAE